MRFPRCLPLALLAVAATGSLASAQDLRVFDFRINTSSIFNIADNGPIDPYWTDYQNTIGTVGYLRVLLTVDLSMPGSGGSPTEVYSAATGTIVDAYAEISNNGGNTLVLPAPASAWTISVTNDLVTGGFITNCVDEVRFTCFGSPGGLFEELSFEYTFTSNCSVPGPLTSTDLVTCLSLPDGGALADEGIALGRIIIRDVDAPGQSSGDTYFAFGVLGLLGLINTTVTPSAAWSEGCFGDGGVQLMDMDQTVCTPCPCGNDSTPGSGGGCKHSASDGMFGGDGARLIPLGEPSLSKEEMTFELENALPGSFAVLTSGPSLAPGNSNNPCFAGSPGSGIQAMQLDGLRCVVGAVTRHGARPIAPNGKVMADDVGPNGRWGYGGQLVSLNFPNDSAFVAGETRHFQAIYRENPGEVCAREQNTSQRVTTTFTP